MARLVVVTSPLPALKRLVERSHRVVKSARWPSELTRARPHEGVRLTEGHTSRLRRGRAAPWWRLCRYRSSGSSLPRRAGSLSRSFKCSNAKILWDHT